MTSAVTDVRHPARQPLLITALVALLALIAGCGAGQEIHTPAASGSQGKVGGLAVRDALFAYHGPVTGGTAYRPGDTVSVQATIINEGTSADQLVSVSSPIAGGGFLLGGGTIPAQHTLAAGYPPSVAATTLPDTTSIDLRLTALTTAIRTGLTYPVIFTFARAGQLRLQLPVQNTDEPAPECALPPDGKPPQILTAPIGQAPTPPTTPAPDCSSLR